jgi:hypothetical protein
MKLAFMILIGNIPAMICAGSAFYMAINGISGWGWFLFVALLFGVGPRSQKDDANG